MQHNVMKLQLFHISYAGTGKVQILPFVAYVNFVVRKGLHDPNQTNI